MCDKRMPSSQVYLQTMAERTVIERALAREMIDELNILFDSGFGYVSAMPKLSSFRSFERKLVVFRSLNENMEKYPRG